MTTNAAGALERVAKFRKKPVVIEAMQFDGTVSNADRIATWARGIDGTSDVCGRSTKYDECHNLLIRTLEGTMSANPGDWIIRGVKGEFYPCKPEIFAATYELASDAIAERQGEAVSGEMDRSAPSRIWLQVDTAGDETDRSETIPKDSWEQLTWHFASLGGKEVEYVRVDLCHQAPAAVDDAMVERALNAYYCHGISWNEAAELCGDTREEMRAALTAALQNGAE